MDIFITRATNMDIFNKIILSLLLILPISTFGMEKVKLAINTTPLIEAGKTLVKTGAIKLSASAINTGFEYISSYAHTYGYGIASGDPDYKTTINYPQNFRDIFGDGFNSINMPPNNTDRIFTNNTHHILTLLAGPIAGVATTSLQCAGLEAVHRYIEKKGSVLNPSFLSQLKYFRLCRLTYGAIYGFLPVKLTASESPTGEASGGYGHAIWKLSWQLLFNNDNCPTISDRYSLLTVTSMLLSFYIIWKLDFS